MNNINDNKVFTTEELLHVSVWFIALLIFAAGCIAGFAVTYLIFVIR